MKLLQIRQLGVRSVLGSLLVFESCVIHRPLIFANVLSFEYIYIYVYMTPMDIVRVSINNNVINNKYDRREGKVGRNERTATAANDLEWEC